MHELQPRVSARRGQMRGGRFNPSGGNPDGGGCSSINKEAMVSGEVNKSACICGNARDGIPPRIIMMQAAPQA